MQSRVPLGPGKFHVVVLVVISSMLHVKFIIIRNQETHSIRNQMVYK